MNERLVLAGLLCATALAGLFLCRRQSPLHLLVLALLATLLVGGFYPLSSLVVQPLTWRNAASSPERYVLAAQAEYLAFAVGLLGACGAAWLAGHLRPSPDRHERQPARISAFVQHRDALVATGLVCAGFALYSAYVARVGLGALVDRADFGRKYLVSTGMGPLASGLTLVMTGCLWAEGGSIGTRARLVFRIVAGAVAMWSVAFISVRGNLVVLALGYLWIHGHRRRLELRRARILVIAAAACLYVGLEAFSLWRGAWSAGARDPWAVIRADVDSSLASIVGGSELAHPFLTALEVLESRTAGELSGRSYVDALPALVPLGLSPDRPLSLSEKFVRANYAAFASEGGGTGFSLVAEAWLNFGPLWGSAVVGLTAGLLIHLLERRRRVRPDGLIARLLPSFPFLVALGHRCESAILLKQVFVIVAPALVLALAAEVVWAGIVHRRVGASPLTAR